MNRSARVPFAWVALLSVLAGGCRRQSVTPAHPVAELETQRPSALLPEDCAYCREQPNPMVSFDASPAKAAEPADGESYRRSPWLESGNRGSEGALNLPVTDQDGLSLNLQDFRGQPLVLTFLYTRCTNPNKCPLVAARMAQLQGLLQEERLASRVHLAIVTYDPDYDTPDRLKRYGLAHGWRFTRQARMLRPDKEAKDRFFDKLQVSVNYDGKDVNIHGIQLFLFDDRGRFVRCYRSVIWDNSEVLDDLKRLAHAAR